MISATLLFVLFALISVVGAYLIAAHHRSRAFAAGLGIATLLFFVGLWLGILALLRWAGA